MKVLFHLGHPAHFHLFKNTINELKAENHQVNIVIKKKDILEKLLRNSGFDYLNILPKGRKDHKIGIAVGQILQDLKLLRLCITKRPDLLVGTSVAIAHVGKLLSIPVLNINEDDAEAVPLYAKLSYPWSTHIIAPNVCSVGKWGGKKIGYEGYHELAYLHPDNFEASKKIASNYVEIDKPYFLIRFAKLGAHHDTNVEGITANLAAEIFEILSKHGNIYITSERELEPAFEKYRLSINPIDIHHVMSFASIYIGDSQTMAAESGVLGVPFIRINDFVGRIGYLKELEEKYNLGYGILPTNSGESIKVVNDLLNNPQLKDAFKYRQRKMLMEKINVAKFFTWFIENFPESPEIIKEDPEIFKNFK